MKTATVLIFCTIMLASFQSALAQFNYSTNNGALSITDYTGSPGGLAIIPTATNGFPITSIGTNAFQGSSLTSIIISDSVTNIGDDAFEDCSNLANLTFWGNAPTLGSSVFLGVATGATVYVYYDTGGWGSTYGGLPIVGMYPLKFIYTTDNGSVTVTKCTGSLAVTIPDIVDGDPVISIGVAAFGNCYEVTSVTIPNSVTCIGDAAFDSCSALTSISIPSNVASIGELTFGFCTSLTNITIPNSVTNIGDLAFSYCTNLTNITFFGNAPALGSYVFNSIATGATVYYYYGTSGWSSNYGGLPTVELFNPPQINSVGSNVGVQSDAFSFTVTGGSNQTIVVEGSTNLVNWQPVWTNTLSGTNVVFTDPQWSNYPSRFYRAQ
jgi:hypothetical protein